MNEVSIIFDSVNCNPCNEGWAASGIVARLMAEMTDRQLSEFAFCPRHGEALRDDLNERGFKWLPSKE